MPNLTEEEVENSIEYIDTGKIFLNKTPISQALRSIDINGSF